MVFGVDHGMGSSRVWVKIIYIKGNGSVVAEAIHGLAEIECPHDDGALCPCNGQNKARSIWQKNLFFGTILATTSPIFGW